MLLILLAMITGASLTAFSSPIGASANAGLSGLRLVPQKPGNDAPFSTQNALQAPGVEAGKPAQRASLINLSV
jgi:hypothetical protein